MKTIQKAPEEEELQMKTIQRAGMEEEEEMQMKTAQRASEEEEELQMKATTNANIASSMAYVNSGSQSILPQNIQAGIMEHSGMDTSNVKVHYNSEKPAQLQAHAYTQGNDIHVAKGQEQYLGHEAWHVVQQRQGRVTPTKSLKGIGINDNSSLEHEADVMGEKVSSPKSSYAQTQATNSKTNSGANTTQLLGKKKEEFVPKHDASAFTKKEATKIKRAG